MYLWDEYIGGLESSLERQESRECVRRDIWLSESNWNQYAAIEVTDMKAQIRVKKWTENRIRTEDRIT